MMAKAPGSAVYSGAVNGEAALAHAGHQAGGGLPVRTDHACDAQRREQRTPRLRRLGDQLGALYTPLALAIALAAWASSGDPTVSGRSRRGNPMPAPHRDSRRLIGAISLAARRGIIIRDPAVLERIDRCRTIVLDKTGTLTCGTPTLTERFVDRNVDRQLALQAGGKPRAILETSAGQAHSAGAAARRVDAARCQPRAGTSG